MVGIIDYGIGNIGSINNMLCKIGQDTLVVTDKESMIKCDKLILPGVGAFDSGMDLLNNSGLRETLDYSVKINKVPLLGICLGMQMLGIDSEEGKMKGLQYIPMHCKRFSFDDNKLKVPHMGWDFVDISDRNNALNSIISEDTRFYFVHSYYEICEKRDDVLLTCDYGVKFDAAVSSGNIIGTQFHPEKSHKYGMKLLKFFCEVF